jgi:PAS domain S-box-containing protein
MGMYYSKQRDSSFDFSESFETAKHGPFALARQGTIHSLEQLKHHSVLVMQGDIMHDFALTQGLAPQLQTASSYPEVLRLMVAGKADYALLAIEPAEYWIHTMELTQLLKARGSALMNWEYCFAVAQGEQEHLSHFNEGLGALKANGRYQQIRNRWLDIGGTSFSNSLHLLQVLTITVTIMVLIAVLGLLWIVLLRREVARKTAALSLREHHYYRLFEDGSDAVFIIRIGGVIQDVNAQGCALTGYSREQLVGLPLSDIHSSAEAPRAAERMGMILREGALRFETTLQRADGSTVDVEFSASHIASGTPLIQALVRDISVQKTIIQQMQQTRQEAQQASQLKSDFLATMSHELRTPLNGIIGLIDLLAQPTTPALQRQEYLCHLQRSAEAMSGIVENILDLSKIEAGSVTLESIDFDIRQMVESIRALFTFRAQQKDLAFIVEIGCLADELLVRGDPTRLRQIVVNLVGNAIKFTERGSITLQVICDTTLPASAARPKICFAVIDTGPGIPLEQQTRIFESFTQSDASTTRRYGGTGLGLAISRNLAKLMDGKLELSSTEGVGSTFSLTLTMERTPMSTPTPSPPSSPAALLPDLSSVTVLVADDHHINRLVAGSLLKNAGATIIEAQNGRETLEQLEHHSVDIILMDIEMPEMDGYEAARRIRLTESAIPIIALTAHALAEVQERCMQSGMNEYLVKPLEKKTLLNTVARQVMLHRNRPL